MKLIAIFLLCSLSSKFAYSCPSVSGKWKGCSVSTSIVNSLELIAVNIGMKTLVFELSNPGKNKLNSKIIKRNLISANEVILDETLDIGKKNFSTWDKNVFEGSTPPEFTTTITCNSTGMIETMTWTNLSARNYPTHERNRYPKYYKSVYKKRGNKLSRIIYARDTIDERYKYVAKINCSK